LLRQRLYLFLWASMRHAAPGKAASGGSSSFLSCNRPPWSSSGYKSVGLTPESVLRGMLGMYSTHGGPLLTFRHPFQATPAARINAARCFEPHLILLLFIFRS
jgi:hypothetical protein